MNPRLSAAALRPQDIIRAYARWAPVYDLLFGAVMARGRRLAAEAVPDDAREVIELGVGTGLSLPCYRPSCRVTGVDLSADMLERARRLVSARGLGHVAGLLEMDAGALAFADDTFDAAVAMYAVTCVPDAPRMLGEACRVVRPGGRLIILSRFAAEHGFLASLGRIFAPVGRLLGFNTRVTASTLMRMPSMKPLAQRTVGLGGYYRLLEFEVVKPAPSAGRAPGS